MSIGEHERENPADGFFEMNFKALTGYTPMRWQTRLFRDHFLVGDLPGSVSIPTGLGKTAVMAIWLIALAWQMRHARALTLPRRMAYVVDRRAVVDQATQFAETLRSNLEQPPAAELRAALGFDGRDLPISTLRGKFVDNRQWLEDPACPAIIVGTVDMIGSRLLFEGYGVTRKMRPYHAGLLGADALVLLDEAHLVPPFEALLESVAGGREQFGPQSDEDRKFVPAFRLLPLSATGRTKTRTTFVLEESDFRNPDDEVVIQRLGAKKCLKLETVDSTVLAASLAGRAWELSESENGRKPVRCLIYCARRGVAEQVNKQLQDKLQKEAKKQKKGTRQQAETELFVGARRVFERKLAAEKLRALGFLADVNVQRAGPAFLIATAAGEVGVDLDADHLVCDLVAWERMVQRFGRVNRRGKGDAEVVVIAEKEPQPAKKVTEALEKAAVVRNATEQTAIQKYLQEVAIAQAKRRPFGDALRPLVDGTFDVSPGALRELAVKARTDAALNAIIAAASTPPPLRPALSRPLVDAWSMTSLEEHTGRPSIEPWLRGWTSDLPQTVVLWRRHLPVRLSTPEPKKKEIEAFFEAAVPHASELLETETFRVLGWLMDRVARLSTSVSGATAHRVDSEELQPELVSDDVNETSPGPEFAGTENITLEKPLVPARVRFRPDEIVGFILTKSGALQRTLRFNEIPVNQKKLSDQAGKKKDQLEEALTGMVLVLSDRFGGLSDGLLDEEAEDDALTADGSVPWDGVTFRVRAAITETAVEPDDNWSGSLRFDLERTPDGEATRWLLVEKWRDASNTEDDRAAGPPQSLVEHQSWAEQKASEIACRLGLTDAHPSYARMLAIAARLHDEGKQSERWQRAFHARNDQDAPYAKTRGPINHALLDGYRHEFGSLSHAQQNEDFRKLPEGLQDLALHLIAAHHGFARPVIATSGCDDAPPSVLEARAREVSLRFARLQKRWGPWGLAWWESLLRAADQQASRANDELGRKRQKENR